MNSINIKLVCFFLLLAPVLTGSLYAQTGTGVGTSGGTTSGSTTASGATTASGSTTTGEQKPDLTSKIFDMSDMPLWAKDVRRAEIVAFGSFPFTMFATQFFMDLYRFSDHGWDTRYAPWPAKGAGAINMTNEEYEKTILYAALASLSIMTIDFSIVQLRRFINNRKTVKGNGDAIRVKTRPVSP
ncbi:MAG: hypothetical protein LBL64_08575 [Treponema sp.]|jgi:hypothetical protein|nr:hypothetical protein [Treponema sp.]